MVYNLFMYNSIWFMDVYGFEELSLDGFCLFVFITMGFNYALAILEVDRHTYIYIYICIYTVYI